MRSDEIRSFFSPSVNLAIDEMASEDTVTPARFAQSLAMIHPKYAGGRLGEVKGIDPNIGIAAPLDEMLGRIVALHDIDAMMRDGERIHTRSVMLDLVSLEPRLSSAIGEDLLADLEDGIVGDGYRIDPVGSPIDSTRVEDDLAASAPALRGHSGEVRHVAVTPDGGRAVTASSDGTACVWDLSTGSLLHRLAGHTNRVRFVAVAPITGRVAVTSSYDHTARVWDLDTGAQLHVLEGHEDKVIPVAVSPDERFVVTASDDHTVRVWDLSTGAQRHVLEGHSDRVWWIAISPDGGRAVTTSDDGTARVWDIENGLGLFVLEGHRDAAYWVAISPDGRRAVTTSRDGTARVWDMDTGAPLEVIDGHTAGADVVAIADDGRLVITTAGDGTALAWDLNTGVVEHELRGHGGALWSVAIAKDGTTAVTTSSDHTARVWDLVTGTQTHVLEGHTGPVLSVALTPDGQHAVTTSEDGTLRIWDIATGQGVPGIHGRTSYQPKPEVTCDFWTVQDNLGYGQYARAIALFIQHDETTPPLTIGVRGPWGAGKTSVMRMVQDRIDPPCDRTAADWKFPRISLSESARSKLQLASETNATDGCSDTKGGTEKHMLLRRLWRRTRKPRPEPVEFAAEDAVEPKTPSETESAGGPPLAPDDWRPTVWFNPWMYQTGEELWAGLAQEIISQVTDRLPPIERESFWFELNLRRVDHHALRMRLVKMVIDRILPALITAAVSLFLFAATDLPNAVPLAGVLVPALVAVGQTVALGSKPALETLPDLVRGPLAAAGGEIKEDLKSFSEVIRDPDYENKAGYLYLLHNDIHHVLELVATRERPLVVFVDDLDRCSPGVVAQTVEAINLFLAGEFPNCIFVLAVEPAVVAAHIESQHAALVDKLEETDVGSYRMALGWRFLEKVIQLPISLPRPDPRSAERFLDGLLQSVASPEGGPARREVGRDQQERLATGSIQGTAAKREELVRELVEEGRTADEAESIATDVAVTAVAQLWSDSDPAVRRRIKQHALDLPARNPREIKRFINLYRFYSFVAAESWVAVTSDTEREEVFHKVARLCLLLIRWPYFIELLSRPAEDSTTSDEPIILQRLEEAARTADHAEWQKAVDTVRRKRSQPSSAGTPAATKDIWDERLSELRRFLADQEAPMIGEFARDYI